MDLEKNKQRLEILAAEVEELKNSGGGGTSDSYTKEEADDKFAEKATTYTKTEVDEAIAAADGNYISKNFPIVGGTIGDKITVNNNSIAIGSEGNSQSGTLYSSTVLGSNKFNYNKSSANNSILIGAGAAYGNSTGGSNRSILIGIGNELSSNTSSVVIANGAYQNIYAINNQLFYSTVLGSYPELDNLFISSNQRAFIVGIGEASNKHKNTVEIRGENALRIDSAHLSLYNGADISFTSNSEFKVGSDTNSYDLRYFAPADETLTDGGTISATALANANKHVPLSFNAHMCYYSYEDNDNVYYTSTRLNGTSLHTNVIAINKTTGVATFNEFDQS